MSDIVGDSHPNDPASPDFSSGSPSWIGETFTYNGGASTPIEINDDDDDFEDAYVETGGAQTLAEDVTINGTTYPAGTVVQNEFAMLDASGKEVWVVRIGSDNVGFAYPAGDLPTAGDDFIPAIGRDGDGADSGDGITSTVSFPSMAQPVCYVPGTAILTSRGEVPVERLEVGDLLITADHGPQPILRIARTDHVFEDGPHRHKPIEIKPGSLGQRTPKRRLVVSPQHRVLFGGGTVERMFGTGEVLALAKGLVGLDHVRAMNGKRSVSYYSLLCARHEIITAEGAASETFYPDANALRMIGPAARREVEVLFPRLAADPASYGKPARRVLTRKETEQLVTEIRPEIGRDILGRRPHTLSIS
ncbi:MAG: Hint domain-containing protein [Pseudomonadota bacterium]